MSKSDYPKISAIMSCYNAEHFLREAIESILSQSYTDFEFILIDDGSTDDTLEIIRDYAHQDTRIIVVEKENTGLTYSLNVGIGMARGEWIARLDADDIALPQRFEEQINCLGKCKDIVLLGSGCIEIDRFGRKVKRHRYPTTHRRFIHSIERGKSPFPHSSVMYKTDTVRKIGGYRIRMNGAEDVDLWLRLGREGHIHCINKPLIKLRKHNESITAKNKRLAILSYAARISHYLRIEGYPDPIDQDELQYMDFLAWVERKMMDEGFFRTRHMWTATRAEYYTAGNKLTGMFWGGVRFLRSGHISTIVWEKFFGSSLPRRLALEWMTRTYVA